MAPPKSWQEKLHHSKGRIKKETNKGLMYISHPEEIKQIINMIPKGKLMTTKQIIDKLAKKYKVDFTCALTTGIFVGIVANAAEEQKEKGKKETISYWRVIKPKGYLYDKYLGQKSQQRKYLKKEGYKIVPSGTKKGPVIKDYEKYLVR